ncbi:MAG TPA: adenosylhomocysteinase [Thermodesulfobacteriota bacterium]|nr:adenosylhomocysteinase [Thermodesulfobacteriota bacterium]
MKYDVKDPTLAAHGKLRVEWAAEEMPVLAQIQDRFKKEKPLKGIRIAACLHITTETVNLAITLKAGGAELALCASNPLSTQDDAAACLVKAHRISVFAIKGEDTKTYYRHIESVLDVAPHITMDDGADLVSTIHKSRTELIDNIVGGTEETTTGVIRLRSMAERGVLRYPIIAVNDAQTKHLFDNRYGTGQSTVDGVIRATNRLIAGTNFVICGYGWCGKGVALRTRGMGANVIVTEVDPLRALEAVMDGLRVLSMDQAAKIGDFFCTVTGNTGVIRKEHFIKMKDGAIICNAGHFNVEIDLKGLRGISRGRRKLREYVEEYTLSNGRRINVLAEGRLVNLSSAEGHPSSVMDMSFANQALCVEYIVKNAKKMDNKVYDVPEKVDKTVAKMKLRALGIKIDQLTQEQRNYLHSWEMGT